MVLTALLCLPACKQNTKPELGIITGTITLDGQTDHSGISVAVFPGSIIPDDLAAIIQDYPQLAFPIEDKHIFDHREFQPLQIVVTNESGKFETPKLGYGSYILCYYKEGWGYNYAFSIALNGEEISIDHQDSIRNKSLYREIAVPNVISGEYIFESNKSYVINQNTTAIPGSILRVQPGTKILIYPNVILDCHGGFVTESNDIYATITSYDKIYHAGVKPTQLGNSVRVNHASSPIDGIVVSYLFDGLSIRTDSQQIFNVSLLYNGTGLSVSQAENVVFRNSVVYKCIMDGYSSVYAYGCSNLQAQYNIFYENLVSFKNKTLSSAVLRNNYFYGGNTAIENSFDSSLLMEHCVVKNQGIGIDNTANSNVNLVSNEISARVCLNNWAFPNSGSNATNGWIRGNNNNFQASRYVVESRAHYYGASANVIMDFRNNYWGDTGDAAISALIIDGLDLGEPGGDYNWSVIDYSAYKHNRIMDAGIL